MARIYDENFKSNGWSEAMLSEIIDAGCTMDENFPIASFTAGTTAPSTLYKYCGKFLSDGDGTNRCTTWKRFTPSITTSYIRFETIVVSHALTDSARHGLFYVMNSAISNKPWTIDLRYTNAGALHFYFTILQSAVQALKATITASVNTLYRHEVFWDVSSDPGHVEYILNSTSLYTGNITSISTKSIREIDIGNYNYTGKATIYFDNIRINDSSGAVNNTWPGTAYDEPLRCVEYLSMQKYIGLEL